MSLFDTPKTPAGRQYDRARQAVPTTVARMVREEHGAEAFEDREIYPGAGDLWRRAHPLPVPHVQAATALLRAAREELAKAIDNARGSGTSWEEIGRELGLEKAAERAGMSLHLATWRYAAMRGVLPDETDPEWAYRGWGSGPSVRWSCRTCTGKVTEGHPDNGLADAQEGHKEGCTRYAADVAAQRAAWNED